MCLSHGVPRWGGCPVLTLRSGHGAPDTCTCQGQMPHRSSFLVGTRLGGQALQGWPLSRRDRALLLWAPVSTFIPGEVGTEHLKGPPCSARPHCHRGPRPPRQGQGTALSQCFGPWEGRGGRGSRGSGDGILAAGHLGERAAPCGALGGGRRDSFTSSTPSRWHPYCVLHHFPLPEGQFKVTLGQTRRTARRPHAGLGLPPAGSSWAIGGRGRMPRTPAGGARTPFLTTRRAGCLCHGGTGWEARAQSRGCAVPQPQGPRRERGGPQLPARRCRKRPRPSGSARGIGACGSARTRPPRPAWPSACRWKCSRAVCQAGQVGSLGGSSGRNQREREAAAQRRRHWFLTRGCPAAGAGPSTEEGEAAPSEGDDDSCCSENRQLGGAVKQGDGISEGLEEKRGLTELEADGQGHCASMGQFGGHGTVERRTAKPFLLQVDRPGSLQGKPGR